MAWQWSHTLWAYVSRVDKGVPKTERERERERYIYICMYIIYTDVYTKINDHLAERESQVLQRPECESDWSMYLVLMMFY